MILFTTKQANLNLSHHGSHYYAGRLQINSVLCPKNIKKNDLLLRLLIKLIAMVQEVHSCYLQGPGAGWYTQKRKHSPAAPLLYNTFFGRAVMISGIFKASWVIIALRPRCFIPCQQAKNREHSKPPGQTRVIVRWLRFLIVQLTCALSIVCWTT